MSDSLENTLRCDVGNAVKHGLSASERKKLQSRISKLRNKGHIEEGEMREMASRVESSFHLKEKKNRKFKTPQRPGSDLPERRLHERPESGKMTVAGILAYTRMRKKHGFSEI